MKNIFSLFIFLAIQIQTFAQCKYVWAKWQDQGQTDTAAGVISVNGSAVNLRLMANYPFDFTPDIFNYPAYSGYPEIPNNDTVPRTNWASGAAATNGLTTICFSPPVTDPVLLLSSVGSVFITVSIDFSSPYNVLYDGGGNTFISNTTLVGHEGYCILEFPGPISCITISSTTPESYTNLTWGVKNPLTADFTFTNSCQNNAISFSSANSFINSPGTISGFHWNFGDGTTSTLANPLHNFTAPGSYPVELVVTANNFCTDTITKTVTINPAYSNINTVVSCNGQPYVFNTHVYSTTGIYHDTLNTISGCDSIIITHLTVNTTGVSVNPQAICAGGNYIINSHIYSTAGNYYDTLTSVFGCDSIVNTSLTVLPYLTSNNFQSVCQGESYLFNLHNYNADGIYYDTLQTPSGCDSIVITSLTINPLPVITFNHPSDICVEANDFILNYASPAGGFYSGSGVLNNIFHPAVANSGTHTITYTYTNPLNHCTNSAQENLTIHPPPTAILSVTPDHARLPDGKITYMDLSPDAISTQWNFGDGNYSGNQSGEHVYGDTGHFQVTLLITDDFGCSNETQITVYIENEFAFYIPNAFTPNGDGKNDLFTGKGAGIASYSMSIFNRWGEEIFTTTDINVPWSGKNIIGDTYVYKINILDSFGSSHQYTGSVSVIN